MKIWLLTTEFPPFFGGGISTYFKYTAEMLAEKGHQVTVLLPDESITTYLEISEGTYRVIRFKAGAHDIYRTLGYMAALSYQFADIVEDLIRREGPPDLIESQEYSGIAYFILHRKKQFDDYFRNIRLVLCLHTPKFVTDKINQLPIYKFPNLFIGEMERYCIEAADYVLSPSDFLLDFLNREYDIQVEHSQIVPNPYRVGAISILESSPNEEIVYFGRIQYLKGLDQLLVGLSALWDQGCKVVLRVIGGDSFFAPKNISYKSYLEKKYEKYIKERLIHFEGFMHPEEAHLKMLNSRLVIVPSLFENFPYAVVEAMALGKLVLTTRNGGQREIIESGVNGFTYDPTDIDDLISKVRYIFENMTITEVIEMGKKANESVSKICSFNQVYTQKIIAYEACLNQHELKTVYPFTRQLPPIVQNTSDLIATSYEEGLLSVVIPYFNMGKWIDDTLESLIHADYPYLEIILVNDGSNEEFSIHKLAQIKEKYPVKVMDKPNGGLASARNAGAKIARGEYLAFLDADDKVNEKYYTRAIEILGHYKNVHFVGCWAQFFEESEAIWPTWDPEPPMFLVHNSVNSSALVYKTEAFVQYGLNDSDMIYGMEDYESVIRLIKENCRGVMITHPWFYYRIRKGQMSSGFNVANQNYLIRLITEKNKELYASYAGEILNIVNSNGPGYLYDNPTWELPSVGFIHSSSDVQIRYDSNELPYELKQKLMQLWQSKMFKRLIGVAFKLKIDRLFK